MRGMTSRALFARPYEMERRKYAEKVVVDRAKKDRLVARKERREAGPPNHPFPA